MADTEGEPAPLAAKPPLTLPQEKETNVMSTVIHERPVLVTRDATTGKWQTYFTDEVPRYLLPNTEE